MNPWDRFVEEFLRRPAGKGGGRATDGPDLSVLDALAPHERESAVDLLLVAAGEGTIGAIQALAHLRADRAAEPLRQVMRRYPTLVRVYAAAALWWLRADPEALSTLAREVAHRPRLRTAAHRPHAAAVLSQIDNDGARRALARVIHDSDYLVRYHAYEGLRGVLGPRREFWNYVCKPDIHHHVKSRIDAILHRAGLL